MDHLLKHLIVPQGNGHVPASSGASVPVQQTIALPQFASTRNSAPDSSTLQRLYERIASLNSNPTQLPSQAPVVLDPRLLARQQSWDQPIAQAREQSWSQPIFQVMNQSRGQPSIRVAEQPLSQPFTQSGEHSQSQRILEGVPWGYHIYQGREQPNDQPAYLARERPRIQASYFAEQQPQAESTVRDAWQPEPASLRPWLRNAPHGFTLPMPQPVLSSPAALSVQATHVSPPKVGRRDQVICSFWYHYGSCSNDPNNPNKTSSKECPYLHYDPGLEHVKVQKVPWQWHKKPCGHDKCPNKDGRETKLERNERLADSGVGMVGDGGHQRGDVPHAYMVGNQLVQDRQVATVSQSLEHFLQQNGYAETARNVNAESRNYENVNAEGRNYENTNAESRNYENVNAESRNYGNRIAESRNYEKGNAETGNHANAEFRRHRNAEIKQNDNAETRNHENAGSKSKSRKNRKRRRTADSNNKPATDSSVVRHGDIKFRAANTNSKETCFFWYHGNCKRGDKCPLLHRLTSPPSFVEPPPDYMHYLPCGLDWCPGDQKHHHQSRGNEGGRPAKRGCIGSGIMRGVVERDVVDEGRVMEGYMEEQGTLVQLPYDEESPGKKEWFLGGFPDM